MYLWDCTFGDVRAELQENKNRVKRFLLWQYMLNKRLLHKKTFVLLLCLVPLLVWGMGKVAQQDSGIMTILLSAEDPQDETVKQLLEKMLQEDSILQYELAEPEQAYELVEAGKADCAWIFREDFQEKLFGTFAGGKKEAPVYVVAQEDTVALQLARTKLYGSIYPYLAQLITVDYVKGAITPAQLQAYYETSPVEGSLFQVVYGEDKKVQEDTNQSYLLVPIRGLLVVFLVLGGLVVTLYYLQDEERGMFAWVPMRKRRGLLYCYLFAAGLDVSIVVVLSLWISEGRLISLRELGLLVLYLFAMAVFCEGMKLLCRKKEILAKLLPLLCLAMLGLCPVFLDLGSSFLPQYLFPPAYYLRALYQDAMIWRMVGYTVVLFAAETLWGYFKKN